MKSLFKLFIVYFSLFICALGAHAQDAITKVGDIDVSNWVSMKCPSWDNGSEPISNYVAKNIDAIKGELAQLDLANKNYDTLPKPLGSVIDLTMAHHIDKSKRAEFINAYNFVRYSLYQWAMTISNDRWDEIKEANGKVEGLENYTLKLSNMIIVARARKDEAWIKSKCEDGTIPIAWTFHKSYLKKYFSVEQRYDYLAKLENPTEAQVKERNALFTLVYQKKLLGK